MSEGGITLDPDENNGVNSSFSLSSVGSDSNVFKSKYEAEHAKTQKLQDKLAGYKTVVHQFSKTTTELKRKEEETRQEISQLKIKDVESQERILHLEKLLQTSQLQKKQGLTDLDVQPPRRHSPSHSHSSPSFEIINKSPSSSSSERSTPVHSLHQQETESPTKAAAAEIHKCTNTEADKKPAQQLQYEGAFPQPAQNAAQQPLRSKLPTNTGAVVGPPRNTFELSRGYSANQASAELTPHYAGLNQLNSYPAAKGGFVSVIAFSNGSKKPTWQMEHEALSKKSGSSGAAQQSTPVSAGTLHGSQNWKNDILSSAASVLDTSFQSSSSAMPVGVGANASPQISFQAEAKSTGARPKEWKPLNTLIPEDQSHAGDFSQKLNDSCLTTSENHILAKSAENLISIFPKDIDPCLVRSSLTASLNDLNSAEKVPQNILKTHPMGDAAGSDDLMKFPSLNTNSESPVSEHGRTMSVTSPIYSQQGGAVATPTDDQSNLACQLESMVAILEKNDSPVGMSDMLYRFAEKVKKMETRMYENQAQIQRQQVQIQSFSKHSHKEESARIREENETLKSENETLLEFIGALKESKEAELEPGWVSVLANQSITDPVRAHYPDSPMMKKIESLSNINAKLFQANKDWHNRWEALRQQTQEEKADLELRVKSVESVNKSLTENNSTMEKQLKTMAASARELIATNEKLEEEKSSMQRVIDAQNIELSCLKTEVKDLTRSKRMLESELGSMKTLVRNRSSQQHGNKELETEIGLLKQQLIIFAEDFEKEKKDRLAVENKAEKLRKERDQIRLSLEAKLKKISVQLRSQEDELRAKARQNADLHYQVDDLKIKLQREQRKSALAVQNPYNYQPPPSSYQGPSSLVFNSGMNSHVNPSVGVGGSHPYINANHASLGSIHHSSPEHLPGAWKCKHCTYINYPRRSVCDICGYTNTDVESLPVNDSGSGRHELQSRGEETRWRGFDVDDIVVNTPSD